MGRKILEEQRVLSGCLSLEIRTWGGKRSKIILHPILYTFEV